MTLQMKVAIYAVPFRQSARRLNRRPAPHLPRVRCPPGLGGRAGVHRPRDLRRDATPIWFSSADAGCIESPVHVVLAESLDRFSRDQEDTAGLFKRLTFAGVNIVTLAEGDITHAHRVQGHDERPVPEGSRREDSPRTARRIEDGKSAGGLCYGYRVVKTISRGSVSTGEREIEPVEAAAIERIFREFIAGVSPKQIAKNLNREGVPGPFGGA